MWRWMFGFKEDSSIPVGAAYKGDGLYNLYCLGCSSNYSSEASMLLHDWVSQCFLYFHHAAWQHFLNEKFFTTERIYFTALWTCIIIVFLFQFELQLEVCFVRVDWDYWKQNLFILYWYGFQTINIT